jgi:hypothetical protein
MRGFLPASATLFIAGSVPGTLVKAVFNGGATTVREVEIED